LNLDRNEVFQITSVSSIPGLFLASENLQKGGHQAASKVRWHAANDGVVLSPTQHYNLPAVGCRGHWDSAAEQAAFMNA
jgi:hypothetical protein